MSPRGFAINTCDLLLKNENHIQDLNQIFYRYHFEGLPQEGCNLAFEQISRFAFFVVQSYATFPVKILAAYSFPLLRKQFSTTTLCSVLQLSAISLVYTNLF